jgi:hypothetical protein
MKQRKITALLLVIAMVMSMVPAFTMTVSASDGPAITGISTPKNVVINIAADRDGNRISNNQHRGATMTNIATATSMVTLSIPASRSDLTRNHLTVTSNSSVVSVAHATHTSFGRIDITLTAQRVGEAEITIKGSGTGGIGAGTAEAKFTVYVNAYIEGQIGTPTSLEGTGAWNGTATDFYFSLGTAQEKFFTASTGTYTDFLPKAYRTEANGRWRAVKDEKAWERLVPRLFNKGMTQLQLTDEFDRRDRDNPVKGGTIVTFERTADRPRPVRAFVNYLPLAGSGTELGQWVLTSTRDAKVVNWTFLSNYEVAQADLDEDERGRTPGKFEVVAIASPTSAAGLTTQGRNLFNIKTIDAEDPKARPERTTYFYRTPATRNTATHLVPASRTIRVNVVGQQRAPRELKANKDGELRLRPGMIVTGIPAENNGARTEITSAKTPKLLLTANVTLQIAATNRRPVSAENTFEVEITPPTS